MAVVSAPANRSLLQSCQSQNPVNPDSDKITRGKGFQSYQSQNLVNPDSDKITQGKGFQSCQSQNPVNPDSDKEKKTTAIKKSENPNL
ncbi:MAG: hypothetical protein JJT94_14830 [Bernardetiaceae bacterium]|nr:hypothetical protein [Bernardetiaceae bacterium]